jgi:RHS repeat-associated protein
LRVSLAVQAYNPYRFNSKRWDPATSGYDMGFRDYKPGLNRFLTRDMYNGALADIQLGTDPWNTNRYAFADGNQTVNLPRRGQVRPPTDGNTALGNQFCAAVMRDRNGSGGMTVQLGCSREFLMEVYLRVDRNEERGWSAAQLHVVYAALISVGILFVSEEDFYIRLGFFRENSTALALSLVEAISACDAE